MGTPFTPGQLGKLQSMVNIGIATALPKLAEKYDPKAMLKTLDGRGWGQILGPFDTLSLGPGVFVIINWKFPIT